jgi:hypothetical protein
VCIYDDDDYQTAFHRIVTQLEAACVSAAENESIEPYPCEGESSQVCAALDHCTWTGTECEFDFDNCTNAAVKTTPSTTGLKCLTSENGCDLFVSGGSTGGGLPHPSSVITQISSTEWEIDQDFFEAIMADPRPLLEDDARIYESEWGDFRFQDVEEGSIAYELGFRSGDIIIKIDNYYLFTFEQISTAWDAVEDQGSWTVTIQRSTVYYEFDYELI